MFSARILQPGWIVANNDNAVVGAPLTSFAVAILALVDDDDNIAVGGRSTTVR
jgi:hypothetical protein